MHAPGWSLLCTPRRPRPKARLCRMPPTIAPWRAPRLHGRRPTPLRLAGIRAEASIVPWPGRPRSCAGRAPRCLFSWWWYVAPGLGARVVAAVGLRPQPPTELEALIAVVAWPGSSPILMSMGPHLPARMHRPLLSLAHGTAAEAQLMSLLTRQHVQRAPRSRSPRLPSTPIRAAQCQPVTPRATVR
jgi:hypothetical protein